MANFFDVSNWSEKLYFQPGGTRNKVVVEDPNTHELYFFKTSLLREKRDYKYEFWSEIIASEIGHFFEFDVLKYDIALNKQEVGCISKSMIVEGQNKLTEGMSYLTSCDLNYNPKSQTQYTFQFISESLNKFHLGQYITKIIEIIIFDSIIGNGDRHQENWGIITEYNDVIKKVQEEKKSSLAKKILLILAISSKEEEQEIVIENLHLLMPGKFAQIYDSGSSLAREIKDEKVSAMLKDENLIHNYIQKGPSEIHWDGEKLNHFSLISKLQKQYNSFINSRIEQIKKKYNSNSIKDIVFNIDKKLPKELHKHHLPGERKELITKLITLRVQKLLELIR